MNDPKELEILLDNHWNVVIAFRNNISDITLFLRKMKIISYETYSRVIDPKCGDTDEEKARLVLHRLENKIQEDQKYFKIVMDYMSSKAQYSTCWKALHNACAQQGVFTQECLEASSAGGNDESTPDKKHLAKGLSPSRAIEIDAAILHLEERFGLLVKQTFEVIESNKSEIPKLYDYLKYCLPQPLRGLKKHIDYSSFTKDDITIFFDNLDDIWNFIDFELLSFIIKKFGTFILKKDLNDYEIKVMKFCEHTTIFELVHIWKPRFAYEDVPPKFKSCITKSNWDPKIMKVSELRQIQREFRNTIPQELALAAFVLCDIKINSVSIEWLIFKECINQIDTFMRISLKKNLQFLFHYKISYISLNEVILFQDNAMIAEQKKATASSYEQSKLSAIATEKNLEFSSRMSPEILKKKFTEQTIATASSYEPSKLSAVATEKDMECSSSMSPVILKEKMPNAICKTCGREFNIKKKQNPFAFTTGSNCPDCAEKELQSKHGQKALITIRSSDGSSITLSGYAKLPEFLPPLESLSDPNVETLQRKE